MTTNIEITNQALAEIGSRSQITSMTDGSQEALYANLIYNPLRDFLLREGDYDWSLQSVAIGPSGTAQLPWNYQYGYPGVALRIRQLVPLVYDPLDPRPVSWNVVASSPTGPRVIVSKEAMSQVIYTASVIEDDWDPIFREAFVRLLGSVLALAIESNLPFSQSRLVEAIDFAGIANLRDA